MLSKAAAHAEAKAFDPAALLQARLYPDMFPLVRQVQICTDFAKGAIARLAGEEPPAWADDEVSFSDLITRVEKTAAYVGTFGADRIDGSEAREITLVRRGQTSVVMGQSYLLDQAMPNFYFHLTTAYAILRRNGVEVGKKDYLGTS
ncbi:MAG: DUF1993 domain-containing protein [Phenylobacterium sp.]|uniref:DUF1993 domain-containing protein n=1 Tax=Phenylobacterium sp. TaxID=1871053 RepID=UPI00273323FA|nr:DUF1993 domain-containing protein [Phenylobacterium sp.]MDP3746257.1 DUF1993 domain-containing protein [Phenylobacterium sp.]